MKRLSKFEEFSINELNYSTYRSAANKLKKIGKKERANKLTNWEHIRDAYKLGTFDLNVSSGISRLDWNKEPCAPHLVHFNIGDDRADKYWKLTDIKTPVTAYLSNLLYAPIEEMNDDITQTKSIAIGVYFMDSNTEYQYNRESFTPFTIFIGIEWDADERFTLTEIDVENGWGDMDSPGLFTDRKNAMNFRKNALSKDNMIKMFPILNEELRETFKEYSTARELEKFYDMVSKISLNLICAK